MTPPELPPVRADATFLERLAQRRSTSVRQMSEPGPNAAQIAQMLTLAARSPDHGKLTPWRFVVFAGAARPTAGKIFAARHNALYPDADPALREAEQHRLMRAPVVVAVVFSPKDSPKVPVWEQQLSAGAVCMNLLHAADAMGFAGKWLSEWIAYDRDVLRALGLADNEQIAGYIYLGTQTQPELERERPDVAQITTVFGG